MQTDCFERAFGNYLETQQYDDAEDALFSIIRAAFLAGWEAAGGEGAEPPDTLIYLLHKKP